MTSTVLIVEDEETLGRNIRKALEREGHEAHHFTDAESALGQLERILPDIAFVDLRLPGMDGVAVIDHMQRLMPGTRIVLMTAHGDTQIAVRAMKSGAWDYMSKPLALNDVRRLVVKAENETRADNRLSYYSRREAAEQARLDVFGRSPAMRHLAGRVHQLLTAEAHMTGTPPAALITGETGTGKGVLARHLHHTGSRADAPFVELNCSSLPANLVEDELFGHEAGAFTDARSRRLGLVETAHGGTLFLDEIGDLELSVQAKLLKLLEDRTVRRLGGTRERSVDVRVVAATHQPLEQMIADGRFRADLYYRLRIVTFELPPLRERGEDVADLARRFVAEHGKRYGKEGIRFDESALAALSAHSWPGNVRELRNLLEQAVLLSADPVITAAALPFTRIPARAGVDGAACQDFSLPEDGVDLAGLEQRLIEQALARAHGNVTAAAKLLNMSRDTLRYRIEKFGMGR